MSVSRRQVQVLPLHAPLVPALVEEKEKLCNTVPVKIGGVCVEGERVCSLHENPEAALFKAQTTSALKHRTQESEPNVFQRP